MKSTRFTPARATGLIVVLTVLLIGAAWPLEADAYVLEGPHILELTARAMGKLTSLKIDQKLLIYPRSQDAFARVLDETVVYMMPRRFRSDIVSERLKRTFLEVADQSLTVIDGRIAAIRDPFDAYQRLLRSRTREQLMKTLNGLGVETAISSLGRIEQTVVFVIGARYPDESVSQLAVDKETFLPIRLLLTSGGGQEPGQRLAFFFYRWEKIQDGWYPAQVTFYSDSHLEREIRVVQLRVNPSIPAGLMDLEALKTSIDAARAGTPQMQKQQAVDSVRQDVLNFQKKFE